MFHHGLSIGPVAHDQKVFRPHTVHDEVIDGAPVFLASQSVPSLPIFHARYFSGHHTLQEAFGGAAGDGEPPHMADIKNRSRGSRGVVLLKDGPKVKRHFPPGKRDDLRALLAVPGIERGAIQSILGHAHRVAMPDCRSCRNDLNPSRLWFSLRLVCPPFLVDVDSGECRCHSPNCQKPASASAVLNRWLALPLSRLRTRLWAPWPWFSLPWG